MHHGLVAMVLRNSSAVAASTLVHNPAGSNRVVGSTRFIIARKAEASRASYPAVSVADRAQRPSVWQAPFDADFEFRSIRRNARRRTSRGSQRPAYWLPSVFAAVRTRTKTTKRAKRLHRRANPSQPHSKSAKSGKSGKGLHYSSKIIPDRIMSAINCN